MEKANGFPEQRMEAGEVLFQQGEASECLYILLEGVLVVVEDGVRIATINEPGAYVGELSLLLDVPRMADVRAETPCRLQVIQDLTTWIQDDPEHCIGVARGLARRLNEMDRRFLEMRRLYKEAGGHPEDEDKLPPALEAFRGYLKAWRVHL